VAHPRRTTQRRRRGRGSRRCSSRRTSDETAAKSLISTACVSDVVPDQCCVRRISLVNVSSAHVAYDRIHISAHAWAVQPPRLVHHAGHSHVYVRRTHLPAPLPQTTHTHTHAELVGGRASASAGWCKRWSGGEATMSVFVCSGVAMGQTHCGWCNPAQSSHPTDRFQTAADRGHGGGAP